jgi:hypothetical protein
MCFADGDVENITPLYYLQLDGDDVPKSPKEQGEGWVDSCPEYKSKG